MRLALNPDSIPALVRIINVPPRGIGKVTLMKMVEGREGELSPGMQEKVQRFRNFISRIRAHMDLHVPSETIRFAFSESGLKQSLEGRGDDELERLENIQELVTLSKRYDSLPPLLGMEKLLEDAALATDQDEMEDNRNAVKLMTVHAAKGLEFDCVFITGLEEGLFPQTRDGVSLEEEEEERRLCYVAITRAKKKVFLTQAAMRTIFGSRTYSMPSRFLDDISEDVIDTGESKPIKTIYLD